MIVKYIGLLSVLFAGQACMADTLWSTKTKITNLYSTQETLIFATEYSNELSLCDNGRRFQLEPDADDYEVQVSVLIAAFMANKTIRMAIDDTQSADCDPKVNRFYVFQD